MRKLPIHQTQVSGIKMGTLKSTCPISHLYIMSTPNLDATGLQGVGALMWFHFKLEYQKGCVNTVADVLS